MEDQTTLAERLMMALDAETTLPNICMATVPHALIKKELIENGEERQPHDRFRGATGLEPLNTTSLSHIKLGDDDSSISMSTATTAVGDPYSPEDPTILSLSPLKFPFRQPRSFFDHRAGNNASGNALSKQESNDSETIRPRIDISSPRSSDSLPSPPILNVDTIRSISDHRALSLRSPCFFHQRFDDAVNIDRVLEEIAEEDDGMSHSRLMATATGVREISKQLQRRPIKRAVRTVMIVTKARDNSLVHLTRELAEWLLSTPRYNSDIGVTVYVDAKLRTSRRFDAPGLVASNPRFETMLRYWTPDICWTSPEMFDLVLTLGGDGTVLYTSCLFQRIVPAVLAFSLGSLGFLTNFEYHSYKESLDSIMGDAGMRVNLRMRFTCTVFRANLAHGKVAKGDAANTAAMVEGEQFEVLNELVIDRGPSPYVSNLELYGDNELLTVVQADGCIFSTPTGSTAYSLSAGGPLTHPSIPGILLTPICPHTLSFRPMVLSDSLMLKVCIPRNSRSTAYASFDGKGRIELRRGDCVQVEAGKYPFPTVVGQGGTGGDWFNSVRKALRWNTRGAVQKGFNAKSERYSSHQESIEEDHHASYGKAGEEDDIDDGEEDEEWDINPDAVEIHSGASIARARQDSTLSL
jgi:NAD kinase